MSTPLLDMEEAYWAYLAANHSYAQVGFREFRTYDGRALRFNAETGWPSDALPAHALELREWGESIDGTSVADKSVGGSALGYGFLALYDGLIVFPGGARAPFESAVQVVRSAIDNRTAHATRLNASSLISQFAFAWGEVASRVKHGKLLFWEQSYQLRLCSPRNQYIN